MKLRSLAIVVAIATLSYLVGRWLWPADTGARADAPAAAPAPALQASRIPPPIETPTVASERFAQLHAAATADNDPLPGTTAFRSYAEDFVAANPEAAEHHMVEYGLTRAEVLELTFFGLLAMRSVDWDDVEEVLGRPVLAEAREVAVGAMRIRSEEMKTAIAAHVAAGDSPEIRMATIRRIQEGYLQEYFRATGMTRELLDELLHRSLVGGPGAVELEALKPPEQPELTDLEAEQAAAAAAPPPPRPPRPVTK